MLWSWPADTNCPPGCGVEKDSCKNRPQSQEGQKQHVPAEAAGAHGGRRELSVSEEGPSCSWQPLQQSG